MSTPLRLPSAPKPRTSARRTVLVWITLLVALVHLALLSGVSGMLGAWQLDDAPPVARFAVRTLAPAAQAASAVAGEPAPAVVPQSTPKKPAKDMRSPIANDAGRPDPPTVDAPTQAEQAAEPLEATPSATPADATAAASATAPMDSEVRSGVNPPLPSQAPAEPAPLPMLRLPPSMRLGYDVQGVVTYAYTGGGELLWLNQGQTYSAGLHITKFGFKLRTWTSRGDITPQGLAPLRFGDKTRSEIAAHFQRDKGLVTFSANTPDVALLEGAQDYLSSFFQLAGMLAGEAERFPAGSQIAFQVVNARSAEPWVFHVEGVQTVALPNGPMLAMKLTREHDAQYDTKVELWLAPALHYMPVHIRLSQGNGDFAELLWRSADQPD